MRVLDDLVERGLPESIVQDNDPGLTSRVLDQWAYEHGVQLRFIDPGKPVQDGFIERASGRFEAQVSPRCRRSAVRHPPLAVEELTSWWCLSRCDGRGSL